MKTTTELIKVLDLKGYGYVCDNKLVNITHKGDVDLGSLTSLPEGIQFNNHGGVFLRSLNEFDATDCGNEKRSLRVVYGSEYGLRVSLGCFNGTEDECVAAIGSKYGKESSSGNAYIKKVKDAFAKGRERYKIDNL